MLAVCHRRRRRPRAVVLVGRLVRRFLARGVLPDDTAVAAVECHHDIAVDAPRIDAAARRVRIDDSGASRDRGEHEHAVSPNDRRGGAATRDLDLPPDVALFTPLDRRIGSAGDSIGERTTPLRPVAVGLGRLRKGRERQRNGDENRGDAVSDSHVEEYSWLQLRVYQTSGGTKMKPA